MVDGRVVYTYPYLLYEYVRKNGSEAKKKSCRSIEIILIVGRNGKTHCGIFLNENMLLTDYSMPPNTDINDTKWRISKKNMLM